MEEAYGIQVRFKILFRNHEMKRPFEGYPWNVKWIIKWGYFCPL
jgi:hypothetical protein